MYQARTERMRFKAVALAFLLAALVAILALANPAWAATFNVTKTADTNDGTCNAADCSLREAIVAANAAAGADTINVPAGDYVLSIANTLGEENDSAEGDLDINGDLTIIGAGARTTTIDANGIDRVLHIPSSVTVDISGVTITGGEIVGDGGGISTAFSNSDLTLTNVAVTGNTASNEGGGEGGGIYFYAGTLIITKSTISGNTAEGDVGNGSGGGGGGIYVDDGDITITNSTISGNTATDGIPTTTADGRGGGIYNSGGGVNLLNATVNGNTATLGANVDNGSLDDFTFKNTIVSNAVDGDNCAVDEGYVSEGNNVDDDATCVDETIDMTDINDDPDLGPLQNNGGPTDTHALLSGSPAIDEAETDAPNTDQRGVARPQPAGGEADIGAFELDSGDAECDITGTENGEVLRGTRGDDVICALGGNDTVYGLDGDDTILGDDGQDSIYAGPGKDGVLGGSDSDIIRGFAGNDDLDGGKGGTGRDRIFAGAGDDKLNVKDGSTRDLANGGAGGDRCSTDRGDHVRKCE